MRLYGYFRSSAAYRVRIAANLKGIAVEHVPIHMYRDGGEHKKPSYVAKNPQTLVPTLELDDGTLLTQSLPIIEYLDATQPGPPIVPRDPVAAARVRAIAAAIACDVHPLNNLRVMNYLKGPLGQDDAAVSAWYSHWILNGGLDAVEQLVGDGPFCFGNAPTLADICLVPQLFNARRFEVPVEHLVKIVAIDRRCSEMEAFATAHPARQADAE